MSPQVNNSMFKHPIISVNMVKIRHNPFVFSNFYSFRLYSPHQPVFQLFVVREANASTEDDTGACVSTVGWRERERVVCLFL